MDEVRGIALVGFMGAGKSTVGEAVAQRLGWVHVDLDQVVEARWGPIPEQIARDGESAFRARELEALGSVSGERTVLSTGGGTPVDARSRGVLESRFQTVHLDVDLETAGRRVGAGAGRPLWDRAEALWADRRSVYGSARSTVDAGGSLDRTVDAVCGTRGPRRLRVTHGAGEYEVVVAAGLTGLREALGGAEVRVVTDQTVADHWGAALEREIGRAPDVVVPAGEAHKTLDTWATVVDALLAGRVDRSTHVLALGGGVVGDLAGFAASAVMRGLPLVQVPTTLLAMVDSSVGGKTGVNHPRGKNLIGAFHAPARVWMALETLTTLAPRERVAGLAEVLKTALVLDAELLDVLEAHADALRAGDPGLTEHVVARSVHAKALVVAEDEREAGRRRLLNAGHTVGHAIERAARYGTVLHGEAVAMGLVLEARWGAAEGVCDPDLPDRITRVAAALGLPVTPPDGLDPETIRDAIAVDKKGSRDILWLPVPVRAGFGACVPLPRSRAHELARELLPGQRPLTEPG